MSLVSHVLVLTFTWVLHPFSCPTEVVMEPPYLTLGHACETVRLRS